MKSLSKQQRDYFIDRIKGEINKEITLLEQIHATGIETVANKQYKSYLKETGLGKIFKEYEEAETKWNKVRDRMQTICKALHEKTDYPGKDNYFHAPYDSKGVEKFLREICNAFGRMVSRFEDFVSPFFEQCSKKGETKSQFAISCSTRNCKLGLQLD